MPIATSCARTGSAFAAARHRSRFRRSIEAIVNSRFHVPLGLALMLAASSQAQHRPASPEEIDYIRLVAKYEALFKGVGNASGPHPPKGALRHLEPRLRRIVGPFAIPGFVQPGQLNNDDMFDVDE